MTSVLKVDNIQSSGGTAALSIDSSGRVTRNVVPAFRAGLSGNQNETSSATNITVEWDNVTTLNHFMQGGITKSSGVFTVPIAGLYQFNFVLRINNVGSGYIIAKLIVNNDESGSQETYIINGSPDATYENLTGSDMLSLSANDNVRINVFVSADTSWNISGVSQFSGVMIG